MMFLSKVFTLSGFLLCYLSVIRHFGSGLHCAFFTVNSYRENQCIGKYCYQAHIKGGGAQQLAANAVAWMMSNLSLIIMEKARNVIGFNFRRSMYCYDDPEAELPGASDTIGSKCNQACGFRRGNSSSVQSMKVSRMFWLSFEMEMPFFLTYSCFIP